MYILTAIVKGKAKDGTELEARKLKGVFCHKGEAPDKGTMINKTKAYLQAKLSEQHPDINFTIGRVQVIEPLQFSLNAEE